MFRILYLVGGKLVKWVFGAGIMKWGFLSVLWFGMALMLDLVLDLLPSYMSGDGLTSATSAFSPQVWFFMDYFMVGTMLSMILSAYCIRFLIRRIPVIG